MVTYREATIDDLRAICVLGQEINAIHHDAWSDVFAPSSDPSRDESLWAEMIGQPNATSFVAESDEEVVGFVNVLFVERDKNPLFQPISFARVGSIGVAEGHRGRGIGRELMRQAEAWASARGARHLSLNVWAFNERAVDLYRELGYDVRSHSMGKRLVSEASAPTGS
ncbi:MAG: GNAT family N-acetyltransferase [Burkholderiaceae bacterium]|nr:GNAT family N-acetyltransferase [Burkholderiaceae bacterium]